jgi:hypothetical protein
MEETGYRFKGKDLAEYTKEELIEMLKALMDAEFERNEKQYKGRKSLYWSEE